MECFATDSWFWRDTIFCGVGGEMFGVRCKSVYESDPRETMITRQACNLFHNLWNTPLLGFKTVNKIAEEGKKIMFCKKGPGLQADKSLAPPLASPYIEKL